MDYEKLYKDALKRAKKMYNSAKELSFDVDVKNLEYIFPELKESKDERIRKALICGMNALKDQKNETFATIPIDDCIAWLEKQGEQKTTNKVEPKFKVGDWITNDRYNKLIVGISSDWTFYMFKDGTSKRIKDVDKKYHLWSIEDAKDGDVLYSLDSKRPFIYKDRLQFSQARGYCCINKFGEFAVWYTSKCVICTDKYIPATKEQRDTLFAKMHEAGFEWDTVNKEVKKIIPIFNIGDTIAKKHNSDINKFGQFTITDVAGGKYWYNDNIICDITEQDEWELVEQKSAEWSEEDEKNLNAVLSFIEDEYLRRWLKDTIHKKYDKPAEWSEEDEELLQHCCGAIAAADYYTLEDKEEMENWLKSLKQRMGGESMETA